MAVPITEIISKAFSIENTDYCCFLVLVLMLLLTRLPIRSINNVQTNAPNTCMKLVIIFDNFSEIAKSFKCMYKFEEYCAMIKQLQNE